MERKNQNRRITSYNMENCTEKLSSLQFYTALKAAMHQNSQFKLSFTTKSYNVNK